MPWYRAGTVTVTNGSPVVTGASTDFVANTKVGEVFLGPDGRVYEIVSVVSATDLRIVPAYQGAGAGGQGYGIQPTSSFARDLAEAAGVLIASFAAVRDGVGQGRFPDGTLAAPGFRFAADQDTGFTRPAPDMLDVVTGGVLRARFNSDGMTVPTGYVKISGPELANIILTRNGIGSWFIGGNIAGENDLVTKFNGTEIARYTVGGNLGFGTAAPDAYSASKNIHVKAGAAAIHTLEGGDCKAQASATAGIGMIVGTTSPHPLMLYSGNAERARIDPAGNFLVGQNAGTRHTFARNTTEGDDLFYVTNTGAGGLAGFAVQAVSQQGWNGAKSSLYLGRNSSTGRSLNLGGTINGSGADYAEYVRKAPNCGTILKGDVCGIDRNGALIRTWADAIRFVVKSTDPNLVGGDNWAAHLGQRPEAPIYETPAYDGPAEAERPEAPAQYTAPEIALPTRPVRADGESDDDFTDRVAAYLVERGTALAAIEQAGAAEAESADAQARYVVTLRQYEVDSATYDAARRAYDDVEAAAGAAHDEAVKVHAVTLAAWEADLEAARQTVDRIAFSGQVPVNVDADTLAACEAALADGVAVYLIAIARGAGIGVTAVREGDMTLAQYMRRVGCVWAIRDGRPWIDVQHG